MIETLFGGLLGGLLRMVPELLKWLDRKDERKHELSMFDKQLEADKQRANAQQLAQTQADMTISGAEMNALIEATKAQGQLTGVRWVDAINSLMRPLITFWWVIVMYSVSLVARFWVLVQAGTPGLDAVVTLWGTDEKAIVMSIISFWFMDRALRK